MNIEKAKQTVSIEKGYKNWEELLLANEINNIGGIAACLNSAYQLLLSSKDTELEQTKNEIKGMRTLIEPIASDYDENGYSAGNMTRAMHAANAYQHVKERFLLQSKEIEELKKERDELVTRAQVKIDSLEKERDHNRENWKAFADALVKSQNKNESLQAELDRLKGEIKTLKEKLNCNSPFKS